MGLQEAANLRGDPGVAVGGPQVGHLQWLKVMEVMAPFRWLRMGIISMALPCASWAVSLACPTACRVLRGAHLTDEEAEVPGDRVACSWSTRYGMVLSCS